MRFLAESLLPIRLITFDDGPMSLSPHASTFSAKSPFSARKPYPGWIASQPDSIAAVRIFATFRYDAELFPDPIHID